MGHVAMMDGAGQAQAREDARVAVHGLACRRGGRLLFAGLDLALGAGQAALLLGPNGIGKSSLLRLLGGLLPAYAGHVDLSGGISLSDDRLALDADLTLDRALAFWSAIDRQDAAVRQGALARLSLDALADVPVRMLSTGQRKRASLARTLGSGAAIWLLDEPLNGLDSLSTDLLRTAVAAHLEGGGIVIAASHLALPWHSDVEIVLAAPADEVAA